MLDFPEVTVPLRTWNRPAPNSFCRGPLVDEGDVLIEYKLVDEGDVLMEYKLSNPSQSDAKCSVRIANKRTFLAMFSSLLIFCMLCS